MITGEELIGMLKEDDEVRDKLRKLEYISTLSYTSIISKEKTVRVCERMQDKMNDALLPLLNESMVTKENISFNPKVAIALDDLSHILLLVHNHTQLVDYIRSKQD